MMKRKWVKFYAADDEASRAKRIPLTPKLKSVLVDTGLLQFESAAGKIDRVNRLELVVALENIRKQMPKEHGSTGTVDDILSTLTGSLGSAEVVVYETGLY